MAKAEEESKPDKFSDLLRTSWIKSAIIVGVVFIVAALVMVFLAVYFDLGKTSLFSDTKAFVMQYGLAGIFLATVIAGTLIPLGSPALVAAAALFGMPKAPLVFVAAVGFTLGMMMNYGVAYWFGRPFVVKRVSAETLDESVRLWNRWGWILYAVFGLIPVLPVELLSLICGLLRTRLLVFITLSFVPRLIVFAALAYFGEYLGGWF